MLIPAHEWCMLILIALIGRRDILITIKHPLGKWLIVLWLFVATIDTLTIFDKLASNSMFYFLSGCAVCLLVPLAFLFVRKYHLRQSFHPPDIRHAAFLIAWMITMVILYFVPLSHDLTTRFFYGVFGYSISSFYILLLLVLYYKNISATKSEKGRGMPEKEQTFNAAQVKQIVSSVEIAMISGNAYLQQKYSLNDLAKETGISTHQLSAFINSYYKMNFSDFINKHRIEYFKKRVAEDPAWQSLTLEGIAKDAGFGNRNTFTRAFKKFHGMTPAEFLKSTREGD